jgi:MFS family permease
VGGLVVAYTAPVIVGGLVMGALLDRFERRRVLIVVNAFLGASVAAVPLLARADLLETWHLYVVAGLYGLLKMANWAGVPSLIPALVPERDLTTANALEAATFGIADVAGPAIAGASIALVGGHNVLAIDAVTYLLFVAVLVRLRVPPEVRPDDAEPSSRLALRPAFRFLRRQPAVLAITLMFMAFNVGEGMLLVLLPVLARRDLGGDAATYGLLLSSFALAATVGSFVTGAISWRWTLGRSIAIAQTAAGVAFLGLALVPGLGGAIVVLVVAGVLVSPMTIWAQTVRMRVIPPELRGRTFGALRTLMQSTPPLGGAIAGFLLADGGAVGPAVLVMALVMSVPGAIGLISPALADEHTHAQRPERAVV